MQQNAEQRMSFRCATDALHLHLLYLTENDRKLSLVTHSDMTTHHKQKHYSPKTFIHVVDAIIYTSYTPMYSLCEYVYGWEFIGLIFGNLLCPCHDTSQRTHWVIRSHCNHCSSRGVKTTASARQWWPSQWQHIELCWGVLCKRQTFEDQTTVQFK